MFARIDNARISQMRVLVVCMCVGERERKRQNGYKFIFIRSDRSEIQEGGGGQNLFSDNICNLPLSCIVYNVLNEKSFVALLFVGNTNDAVLT